MESLTRSSTHLAGVISAWNQHQDLLWHESWSISRETPTPDQDIKFMIKSNDGILLACSRCSHKIAKLISNHNIRVLVFIQSLNKEANSSSRMKITSAACMFLFLGNSAGANIRGLRVLIHDKKQEVSASMIDVSRNYWLIDLIWFKCLSHP